MTTENDAPAAGLVRDLQLLLESYTAYAGDAVPASITERSRELHARLSALSQPVATPALSQDAAVAWRCERDRYPDGNGQWHYFDGPPNPSHLAKNVQPLYTRPAEAQAVAEGWKLVPVDPTEAILDAYWYLSGESTAMRSRVHHRARLLWQKMLAASPAEAQAVAEGWRDMASAPKDRTWVLLRGRNAVGHPMVPVVAAWCPYGATHIGWCDSGSFKPVDHLAADPGADWMPLPAASPATGGA